MKKAIVIDPPSDSVSGVQFSNRRQHFHNCCILWTRDATTMRLKTEITMNDREPYDTDDAVAALHALHSALADDLEELEARISALDPSLAAVALQERHQMANLVEARTALYSGLASIEEVLGWVQWKTEEDPEGDVAVAMQPLPTLRGYSVH
ncbi:hypothetical protein AB4Z32_14380 [Massilia sp. 2TAF26]|uniref:hypothetical protein n=1 Tax=Massilia sp. 2TAF26 TaxID=3233012 RepID=UPI003F9AEF07